MKNQGSIIYTCTEHPAERIHVYHLVDGGETARELLRWRVGGGAWTPAVAYRPERR